MHKFDKLTALRQIFATIAICSACASEAPHAAEPAIRSQALLVTECAPDAPDDDADGLCDAAEEEIGTDPTQQDTDGDALKDGDEVLGHRVDGALVLDLAALGADPLHKDIFLEIDYYPGFRPSPGVIEMVVEAFAAAPVSNPDGTAGIRLHVDLDDEIRVDDVVPILDPDFHGVALTKSEYFEPARAIAYHYGLFADRYIQESGNTTSSGRSDGIGASDFIVTLGAWDDRSQIVQAGTLMHELGHNLGLRHGGHDDFGYKPHYLSLMNYHYQTKGLIRDGRTTLDYARISVAGLDERYLIESRGIQSENPEDAVVLARYAPPRVCTPMQDGCYYWRDLRGRLPGPLDFDADNAEDIQPVSQDLDADGVLEVYRGLREDWSDLYYGGGLIGDPSHFRRILQDGPPCLSAEAHSAQAL